MSVTDAVAPMATKTRSEVVEEIMEWFETSPVVSNRERYRVRQILQAEQADSPDNLIDLQSMIEERYLVIQESQFVPQEVKLRLSRVEFRSEFDITVLKAVLENMNKEFATARLCAMAQELCWSHIHTPELNRLLGFLAESCDKDSLKSVKESAICEALRAWAQQPAENGPSEQVTKPAQDSLTGDDMVYASPHSDW